MFSLRSIIISAAVLAGAYAYTFGLPEFMSNNDSGSTSTVAGKPSGGPPAGGRRGGGATTVVLSPLTLQPYEVIMRAIGSSEALNSVNVTSSVSGEVTSVHLKSNGVVSKGDVLVTLDAKTQNLNLTIAKVKRDQANETVKRFERLRAGGSSAVTNVEYTEAKSALLLAQADVGLAQIALDDRTIRAPISGKIGLSNIEVGQIVSANSSIVTIDQSDKLLVEFELPERSIGLLTTERKILAGTPLFTGRVFEGDIVSSDSRIDSVTRSVTVKAQLDNSNGELWPGMTFAVRIIHESEPLPSLPSTAIAWTRNGSTIWIDNDGVAEQVPATILYRQGETVWLDTKVAEGTMVVTEGTQKLRKGSKIVEAGAKPKKKPSSSKQEEKTAPESAGKE